MKFAKTLLAASSLAACSMLSTAWAQEAPPARFDVLLTIESTCSIDTPAATDVDFGNVASTATAITTQGSLFVHCTQETAFDIALDAGENGADVSSRAMSDGAGNLVPYQLYQESSLSTVWGQTVDTDTVDGIGTGDVEEYTVYGLVPSANFPAGNYSDTVTATVIW